MKNESLLTIKEFAEKAGVSVQSVYKRLNNSLNPYVEKVDSHKMLKIQALNDVYGVEVKQPFKPKVEKVVQPDSTLYEILKAELDAKNKQIEELQRELEKERDHSREQSNRLAIFAEQAQKLQLAQMTVKNGLEGVDNYTEQESIPKRKKWQFWKNRKSDD